MNYEKLIEKLSKVTEQAAQAEGAKKAVLERIRKEFGCASIEKARTKLLDLQKKEDSLRSRLDRDIARFQKKYPNLL